MPLSAPSPASFPASSPGKRPYAAGLIFGLILLTGVVVLLVTLAQWLDLRHERHESVYRQLESRVARLASEMEDRTAVLESAATSVARRIQEASPETDEAFERILSGVLKERPTLFGLLAAYAPGDAPGNRPLFAPYATRKGDAIRFRRIEQDYDYTAAEHTWYTLPMEKGLHITPLYYGQSGGDWMITYARKFQTRPADGGEPVTFIVGAEYTLSQLWSFFRPGHIAADGYAFLFNGGGNLLAHPDQRLIAEKALFQDTLVGVSVSERTKITEAMETRVPVLFHQQDPYTRKAMVGLLRPVEGTDWFVCQLIQDNAWGATRNREVALLILLSFTAVWIAWGAAGLLAFRVKDAGHRFRRGAPLVTGTTLVATVCVWVVHLHMGQYHEVNSPMVGLDVSLEEVLRKDLAQTILEHRTRPVISKVGVLVRALRKNNADEYQASGIVWQRLPIDRPGGVEPGIHFPDAEKATFIQEYQHRDGDALVTGWKFNASLRQKFNNQLFPFDRMDLRLRIRQRDLQHPVLIVPDLEAHRIGVPSALPYVAGNTSLPGWVIERTFYTMGSHAYDMDFGLRDNSLIDDLARSCTLHVLVRREWLSSLMGVIIPIFIIMGISFAGIRMISSRPEVVAVYDFKPQRLVMLAASFCLFLVLISAGLRQQLSSSGVFYAEWLFFFLYLLLGLNCWLGASIASGRGRWSLDDGQTIKRAYWPVVLTVVYLITFLMFFEPGSASGAGWF